MKKSIVEETAGTKAHAAVEPATANKKATRAPRRAPVVPAKGKAARKATPARKAPRGAKGAKRAKPSSGRQGSKTAAILDLLKRPGGATASELMEATGWQPHSVRGFLSGTLRKKMGLTIASTKGEDGERNYAVKG